MQRYGEKDCYWAAILPQYHYLLTTFDWAVKLLIDCDFGESHG
jgi:hypothetical protein